MTDLEEQELRTMTEAELLSLASERLKETISITRDSVRHVESIMQQLSTRIETDEISRQ